MVEPFGEGASAEVFKFSLFLVLCNRLTSCAVAIVMLLVSCNTFVSLVVLSSPSSVHSYMCVLPLLAA